MPDFVNGKCFLGLELGSTRIKISVIDDNFKSVASGSHSWENKFENGYFTYSLSDIHAGIQSAYKSLCDDIFQKYHTHPTSFAGIGISAMMHGILAFDVDNNLLVPFRTWRNTACARASSELSELFDFNIPERWTCAHFYESVLNNEPYVHKAAKVTTLAGYVHNLLCGENVVCIGDASGIFPCDENGYDEKKLALFSQKLSEHNVNIDIKSVFPKIKKAGEISGYLTESGAKLLDISGNLQPGIPMCPPEGDAGTGMVATNSVSPKTGNISAGTSIFSMLVLDKPLKKFHPEIDVVSTPDGLPTAMIHSNSCCTEIDFWVNIFSEFSELMGFETDKSMIYNALYKNAMNTSPDVKNVLAYGFISPEPAIHITKGFPSYRRNPASNPSVGEFFRAELYSTAAVIKIGSDILSKEENIKAELMNLHGGLFKVKGAAAQIMADALDTKCAVSEQSGEGGAYGMALLAAYMILGKNKSLSEFLNEDVFADCEKEIYTPTPDGVKGFENYTESFKKNLDMYR